jgi:AcrR family transcriptional regulator
VLSAPVGSSKRRILEHAVRVATREGLDMLTIARLADDLGMSKAGVYGHFGSKERLQLDTLAVAGEFFREHVVGPAEGAPPGLPRLWAICSNYLGSIESGGFPDGDFWVTVANEYHSRTGPVRDDIAGRLRHWVEQLESQLAAAVEQRELTPCDVAQVAFEIEALLVAGDHVFRLQRDPAALVRARAAIRQRLGGLRPRGAPRFDWS